MTRDELIREVALRMDEITPEAGLSVAVDAGDNNPLYAIIDGLVDSCALELFSVAPYLRLPQTNVAGSGIAVVASGGRYIIRVSIGDDFLRIGEINCPAFQRPITELYPEESAMGKRQHNRFLMAKEAKPVGVISHDRIDCYSVSSSIEASSVSATYIAKPGVISTVENTVPPLLIPALEWLIAARTFGARGDAAHAGICQQNAQNLLV